MWVSPIGRPHLIDPSRLERSARRLYGDMFDPLWGELAPVPEENVRVADGDVLGWDAFPTPGHASHHVSYLRDGTLLAGDATGVRMPESAYVLPVCPPPDITVEGWHETIAEIRRREPERLALIHFGVHEDVAAHLDRLEQELDRWAAPRRRRHGRTGLRRRSTRRPGRGRGSLRPRRAALAVVPRHEAVLGLEASVGSTELKRRTGLRGAREPARAAARAGIQASLHRSDRLIDRQLDGAGRPGVRGARSHRLDLGPRNRPRGAAVRCSRAAAVRRCLGGSPASPPRHGVLEPRERAEPGGRRRAPALPPREHRNARRVRGGERRVVGVLLPCELRDHPADGPGPTAPAGERHAQARDDRDAAPAARP